MSGVGPMLLGGALVALGVLASALADRIRGLKMAREASPVRRERAEKSVEVEAIDQAIAKEALRESSPKRARSDEQQIGANEVIAALVNAGYKKSVAAEAVWGCGAADRVSIESWMKAALRGCAARGGRS